MADQVTSMIRDSDIKFECRLLLLIIESLPSGLQQEALKSIRNIVALENKRLDALKEAE